MRNIVPQIWLKTGGRETVIIYSYIKQLYVWSNFGLNLYTNMYYINILYTHHGLLYNIRGCIVIFIYDWTGLVNCKLNWGQLEPTSTRLVFHASLLGILHIIVTGIQYVSVGGFLLFIYGIRPPPPSHTHTHTHTPKPNHGTPIGMIYVAVKESRENQIMGGRKPLNHNWFAVSASAGGFWKNLIRLYILPFCDFLISWVVRALRKLVSNWTMPPFLIRYFYILSPFMPDPTVFSDTQLWLLHTMATGLKHVSVENFHYLILFP